MKEWFSKVGAWIAVKGQAIKSWSVKKKVIVSSIAGVIVVSGVATGIWFGTRPEPVKETVKEEIVVEPEVIIEDDAVPVTLTGESLEKDLKVKLADAAGNAIAGTSYQVILVPAEGDAALAEWTAKAAELDAAAAEQTTDVADGATDESTADSQSETPDSTTDDTAGLTQEQLAAKQAKEEAYVAILNTLDGAAYADDDQDGYIHVEDLEPVEYDVWYVPLEGYSTDTKAITVAVKDQVEYKKVDVADKVKKYTASEDKSSHNTATESVKADTVAWVESSKTRHEAVPVYTGGKQASLSTSKGATVASASGTIDGGAANNPAVIYNVNGLKTTTLTWSSASASLSSVGGFDANIASVSLDQSTITVTAGTTPGTTTATFAVSTLAGTSEPETISITINNKSTADPLKDSAGNTLYKDASGNVATVADYQTAAVFYTMTMEPEYYTYTGWQTIDGSVYYYTADGVPVTGEQVIAGTTYHFDSNGALVQGTGQYGIDVSKWQGNIDWSAVRNAGISYAIIRCGGRYQSGSGVFKDPKFEQNVSGASAAGIRVGIYFYSTAVNQVEAVEEASYTLQLISGKAISYPVFIDIEDKRQSGLSTEERTNICTAFCETIRSGGYTPGVYANYNWMTTKLNMSTLSKYCVWIARYNTTLGYSGKYDIWQHSSKGQVPGISGNVDMNLSYMGY